MYHMGVVKALLEQRLLPRVISGTSGGSIVAGFLAQRTDEEMLADVCVPTVSTCLPERWFPPLHEQVLSFVQHGSRPPPALPSSPPPPSPPAPSLTARPLPQATSSSPPTSSAPPAPTTAT